MPNKQSGNMAPSDSRNASKSMDSKFPPFCAQAIYFIVSTNFLSLAASANSETYHIVRDLRQAEAKRRHR